MRPRSSSATSRPRCPSSPIGPAASRSRSVAACGPSPCSRRWPEPVSWRRPPCSGATDAEREVALLTVRGSTPAAVALKAVLELSGALVIGSAAGVVLAYRAGRGGRTVADARARGGGAGRCGWGPSPCCSRLCVVGVGGRPPRPDRPRRPPAPLAPIRSLGDRARGGDGGVLRPAGRVGRTGEPRRDGQSDRRPRADVPGAVPRHDGGRRRPRPRPRPRPAARHQP